MAAALLIALVAGLAAAPAWACDVAATTSTTLPGSYSPAALRAGAVPFLRASGGFGCDGNSIVALLSGNYLRAKVASGAVLKLTSATGDIVTYTLAADSGGATPLPPGTSVTYMQNTTVNVAGLLGSDIANVPVYARPAAAGPIAAGTYTGSVSIRWDWSFCRGVSATNVCILGSDTGSKSATVTLTLVVAARPATVTMATMTTWDPVDANSQPKSIPGSRGRLAITVTNPDLVALDANSLAIAVPTPPRLAIALDGDGTGSGAVIQTAQGNPASSLALTYATPDSSTDDVDFSADNGATWTFAPVAGDPASEGQVTQVRFRPRGSMAPGSAFTISVPYSVK